jgi:hypothetical protein
MSGYTKRIVNRPPPHGYSWQVLNGAKLLRSDNASSYAEADAAADRAIAELEAEADTDETKE